jgi:S-adenosyl methyltransferase
MLVAILHFTPDECRPAEIIATLVDALPRGSYLVASHLTTEHDPVATSAGQQTMREAGMAMQKRDSDVFASLAFSGLELVPPGVVLVSEWRPTTTGPRPRPADVNCYAGVARKP